MNIAGIEQVSTVDWPEEIASVFFVAGCNFECPWCFNQNLISFETDGRITYSLREALELVPKQIRHIVISGGEPFAQEGIIETIHELKRQGYKVAVNTNGSFPDLLDRVIYSVDYVAQDIKGLLSKYPMRTGCSADETNQVFDSMIIITDKNLPHEFRTTVIPGMNRSEIYRIACLLKNLNAQAYYLQTYDPVNGEDKKDYMSADELREIAKELPIKTLVRG